MTIELVQQVDGSWNACSQNGSTYYYTGRSEGEALLNFMRHHTLLTKVLLREVPYLITQEQEHD